MPVALLTGGRGGITRALAQVDAGTSLAAAFLEWLDATHCKAPPAPPPMQAAPSVPLQLLRRLRFELYAAASHAWTRSAPANIT